MLNLKVLFTWAVVGRGEGRPENSGVFEMLKKIRNKSFQYLKSSGFQKLNSLKFRS